MSTMLSPVFRRMQEEDLGRIMEVELLSFTSPWSRYAFEGELTNHFARYLVVLLDHQIVGYGGMWLIMDEAHVTNVAIHPKWRGYGLGAQLMEQLMAEAVASGAEHMTLEVRVSNHVAQSLYRRMGFTQHGLRKGYYSDNQEDALIMWANLTNLSYR